MQLRHLMRGLTVPQLNIRRELPVSHLSQRISKQTSVRLLSNYFLPGKTNLLDSPMSNSVVFSLEESRKSLNIAQEHLNKGNFQEALRDLAMSYEHDKMAKVHANTDPRVYNAHFLSQYHADEDNRTTILDYLKKEDRVSDSDLNKFVFLPNDLDK